MASRREETLATLHTAATDIQRAETVETACRETVTAAEEILEFEMCSVIIEQGDWLVPIAVSDGSPEDGARRMRPDEGLAGETFQTKESFVIGEVETDDTSEPAKDTYRSGLSVPIGDVGVFQAVALEPNAFDDTDRELAELLVAHTARTIDRIRYETELEANQARLEEQNDRLERFASVVSHDLRGPLNVAMGELEAARAEVDSEHLSEVAWAHDRMAALIEDLLTVARTGMPVEDTEAVDLADLAEDCWDAVCQDGASLTESATGSVLADRSRLQQLLENLFRNAVEHGGDRITLGDLDDGEGFFVADDGPGIPPEDRESVLEWGYSTSEDGTGFGLAIVAEVAAAHGWTTTIAESDEGGARIEIRGVERP